MAIHPSKQEITPRTVSDFLEDKIVELTDRRNSLLDCKNGIIESREKPSDAEHQQQLEAILAQIKPTARDLLELSRSKRVIEQDIEEELSYNRRKRARKGEPDTGHLERAYANSLVLRVMGCSVKKKKDCFSKHDQARFRSNVLQYYDALYDNLALCVVTGTWFEKENVKAAHLVPKSLSPEELSFIFGADEIVASNPRNGLPLHRVVEAALDLGKIAIVPIIPLDNSAPRWKCILVEEGCRHDMVLRIGGGKVGETPKEIITWDVCIFLSHFRLPANAFLKQFDQRELSFRGCNRPARRFLYLRFIITYLHAKVNGNTSFTNSIESRRIFWASEGQYLHNSTLCSLARNISGLELPESLASNTFHDTSISDREADSVGAALAADLHRATVESAKNRDEDYSSEEDDSESDYSG